jgi:hypothetical protein
MESDGQSLMKDVLAYYHRTLKDSQEALDYLKSRGIYHEEAIERFQLGYANRTLGMSLSDKQRKAGKEIRGKLERLGLYRESGHEHFNGCLVVPVFDEGGSVQQVYGRKLLNNLRKGTAYHVHLPGAQRGAWNVDGMAGCGEVILCKGIIDALTFWCAGYCHVTAAHGVEGFTADHVDAFKRHGIQRVLIAFDRDERGDLGAEEVARQLQEHGIASSRIQLPYGLDVNAYALQHQPAEHALGALIQNAKPLGSVSLPCDVAPQKPQEPRKNLEPSEMPYVSMDRPEAQETPSDPPVQGDQLPYEIQGSDLFLPLEDRRYRVRGWQKPLNPESLKVNLMVSRNTRFHVDTLDLYQAKARTAFIRQAGDELHVSENRLKEDLGKVLRTVEAIQADQLAQALAAKDSRPALTDAERKEALSLLQSPDLMRRIRQDFHQLGIVGEDSNLMVSYVAGVSRLLDRPLALLIQSASAAGKTSLMDAVLNLMPPEDLVRYSAMSAQSLFYMGNRDLKHKLLAIAEEEGAKQAGYALKLLQSEGQITMASTGKDKTTGMLTAHEYTVEGPVSLFLTTTAIDLNEELLNRCLVLTVNESREQTRAIHGIQRQRETLEGLLERTRRDHLISVHRNAQRLLEPLVVVNPYADQLTFLDHQTRSRRDHMKYLTLIRAIALLHQHQREVKTLTHEGHELRYIEVTPKDIELANELALEVFSRTVDELLPQTRKLLTQLYEWVGGNCERMGSSQADFRFTRKQVREGLGCRDTQLRIHLDRLVSLEYVLAHRGRQGLGYTYELVFQGEDPNGRARLLGLIDPSCLASTPTMTTSRGQHADFAGGLRVDDGVVSGGARLQETAC